jgi:hypothetical protein
VLWTGTAFVAHWISTRLDLALRRAAVVAGVAGRFSVRARPSRG